MEGLLLACALGGPLGVNTYVAGTEGGRDCVVVDPGAEEIRVRRAVAGRRVSAVLLTHGHFDHILHAAPWLEPGVRLYVHRLDAPMLSDEALNLSRGITGGVTLRRPDVLLEDGDEVREAGLTFRVLHTPGHTPGSVCYLCGDVLLAGDTLFYRSYGRTDLPGGDPAAMWASLRRLFTLDPGVRVYPGHGVATDIGSEQRLYR